MERLSLAQIQKLRSIYGSAYVWLSDDKKAGKMCCDCSGLISSCTGIVRNSAEYKATALERVEVAEIKADWKKYVGWGLWLNGHIGVVSDKEGYYYAMDGSERNMSHLPLNKQPWIYAIKLKDIDYKTEDIDMEELKKLQTKIDALEKEIEEVKAGREKVYATVDDVPSWGRPTVEKLMAKGSLKGTDKGLDLPEGLLRQLVINDREGLYG